MPGSFALVIVGVSPPWSIIHEMCVKLCELPILMFHVIESGHAYQLHKARITSKCFGSPGTPFNLPSLRDLFLPSIFVPSRMER